MILTVVVRRIFEFLTGTDYIIDNLIETVG